MPSMRPSTASRRWRSPNGSTPVPSSPSPVSKSRGRRVRDTGSTSPPMPGHADRGARPAITPARHSHALEGGRPISAEAAVGTPAPLLTLDGSLGEGGGAILRQALGLAIYARQPIQIVRIRARLRKPGLQPQHLAAIEAAAAICGAEIEGCTRDSQELIFRPGPARSGEWALDVGTAGAATLVLQAVLLPALTAPCKLRFELTGGTDTTWSPPADYLAKVTLPALAGFGRAEMRVMRRGYYPRGGGCLLAELEGSSTRPGPLVYDRRPSVERIRGLSHASEALRARRVVERQAASAKSELAAVGVPVEIDEVYDRSLSPDSGTLVWTEGSVPALAGSALGARGRSAEAVGSAAAGELRRELDSGASVDLHLADQLVPFLAVSGGRLHASTITEHTRSNIRVAREVLGSELRVDEARGLVETAGGGRDG